MTRDQYIAGKARAAERLAATDRSDKAALFAALLVYQAYQRIPEMLPGWPT